MDDESVSSKAAATLALAHSALDDLFAADLALDTSDDVLNVCRELNRLRNRLAGLERGVIADVQRRGLPFELGARNTAALLRDLLRISGAEASARVRAADAAASRTSLLGEALPAPFPVVAAAQATGAISPAHARVVVQTVEELPDAVQVAEGAAIEAQLVDLAHRFDPTQVATLAHRIAMHHDPDGVLKDCEYRDKHRDLRLTRRADGSGDLTGAVTAELGERLEVVFDALAGSRAEVDGVKDARTAGQRRHDALLEVLEMAQRAELLPSVHGVSATIVIHVTDENWATGAGTATTSHGAVIATSEAIRWAGGDHRLLAVAINSLRDVTGIEEFRRCFTEHQRLAMAARDIGCTFPGCTAPAARCQTHHLTDWTDGGPTTLNNGALVCAHDHRERIRQGWTSTIINHHVAWIPPAWLDPRQEPRYNTAHQPSAL